MKARVMLFKTDGDNKGKYPVKLILSHKGKTRRKTIGYSKERDWFEESNKPRSTHPDSENLWVKIEKIDELNAIEYFRELDNFDAAFSYALPKNKKQIDFLSYGEERAVFMENIKGNPRHGNARAYRTALNELKKFQGNVTFRDMTRDLMERFKNYKVGQGVKNSTVKNYLVELRAIYNTAIDEGITEDQKPFKGLFKNLRVPKNRNDNNRYLTRDQIKLLEGLELDPSYQRAIDLTLLQFYLCGADLVDVYHLRNEDIRKGRVWLLRHKLGDRAYYFDVKLVDKAKIIIDKYKVEGEYLFPWSKDPQAYITFRNNHNRNLKIIQKRLQLELEPRGGHLTTKTMRHTFATLGKDKNIYEDMLRELMGHERRDIDNNYKAKFKPKKRDKAQRKVLGIKKVKIN